MSLVVGLSVVLFLGRRWVNVRHAGSYLLVGLLILLVFTFVVPMTDILISALGRDSTLTGRTEVWEALLAVPVNPIVGVGFESFWLGEPAERLWATYWWRPNEAHNGYLETYLNLGWVGVILLAGWILSAFRSASRTLSYDFDFGRFRTGVLAIALVYNWTEAAFRGTHPLWLLFFVAAMDCRGVKARYGEQVPRASSQIPIAPGRVPHSVPE